MLNAENIDGGTIVDDLFARFGADLFVQQQTADNTPTLWVDAGHLLAVLEFLKPRYPMLYDLFGIDERCRENRDGQPASEFTVVSTLSPQVASVQQPGHVADAPCYPLRPHDFGIQSRQVFWPPEPFRSCGLSAQPGAPLWARGRQRIG